MKKTAAILMIIISMLFISAVAAENDFSVEYEQFGYKLSVSGDIRKAVNITVFKDIASELTDTENIGELTVEKVLASGGAVVAARQFEEIGYGTLTVPISAEFSDGILYAFVDGEFAGSFKYIGTDTLEKRAEIIAKINQINVDSSGASDELRKVIAESRDALDLSEETLESWDSEAARIFLDYLPIKGGDSAEQMDAFEKAYYISTALRYINKNNDFSLIDNKLKQYSRILGFDTNKYGELSESERKTYTSVLNEMTFYKRDLNGCFTEAEIVAKCVNSQQASILINLLNDNKDIIGLKIENYKMVDESIAEMLKSISKVRSYKGLISCFEDANAAVLDANSKPSGGNGGGGGGSKGSTGVAKGYEYEYKADGNTENKVKKIFNDMSGAEWAKDAVQYLADRGIIEGKTEGVFDPNSNVTRAEFAKIVALAGNLDNKYLKFDDVALSDWYCGYIGALYENKIMYGKNENEMYPEDYITRQEAATMIKRLADTGNLKNSISIKRAAFGDLDIVQDYAKDAVEILGGNEIITGYEDGKFHPEENLTRAECAVIIYRLLSL